MGTPSSHLHESPAPSQTSSPNPKPRGRRVRALSKALAGAEATLRADEHSFGTAPRLIEVSLGEMMRPADTMDSLPPRAVKDGGWGLGEQEVGGQGVGGHGVGVQGVGGKHATRRATRAPPVIARALTRL